MIRPPLVSLSLQLAFEIGRLHEAGMIKSSPQKIMADATDRRF
jgi:hypothetical protein